LPSIEMRSRKGLQFALAPADLSLLLTGRVMVSSFIQFHLASCTESEKGRLPGLAVSVFPVSFLWGSSLVEIARLFGGVQSVLGCARRRLVKTVHVDLKLTGIH
jgi:hypothetical protein